MKHVTNKNFMINCITVDDTIIVPFGTTNINAGALRNTRATTIVLPNTVTKIGGSALPKTVINIIYIGNEQQWEDIKKSPIWSGSNIPKIKIYNSIAPLWDCVKKLNKEFDSLPEVKMNSPIKNGSRADAILEKINKVGQQIRLVNGVAYKKIKGEKL